MNSIQLSMNVQQIQLIDNGTHPLTKLINIIKERVDHWIHKLLFYYSLWWKMKIKVGKVSISFLPHPNDAI